MEARLRKVEEVGLCQKSRVFTHSVLIEAIATQAAQLDIHF